MDEAQIDRCYRPAPVRQPEASRQCLVGAHVLHNDGVRFSDTSARGAFVQGSGAMMVMAIGKARAGRMLDGIEHNAMPVAANV